MSADKQDPEVSESGVFFDSKANKVVDSPPEEGVQLVPPGGELTADVKAVIERHESIKAEVEVVNADPNLEPEPDEADEAPDEVETATEPEVETPEKPARRARKVAKKG